MKLAFIFDIRLIWHLPICKLPAKEVKEWVVVLYPGISGVVVKVLESAYPGGIVRFWYISCSSGILELRRRIIFESKEFYDTQIYS